MRKNDGLLVLLLILVGIGGSVLFSTAGGATIPSSVYNCATGGGGCSAVSASESGSGLSIFMSWNDYTSCNATLYNCSNYVYRNGSTYIGSTPGSSISGGQESFTDSGPLSCNTSYNYFVQGQAPGEAGSWSNSVTTAPCTPSITVTPTSQSTMNVTWSATSNVSSTAYFVYRCTGSGCTSWSQVGTVSNNGTSYSDTGLSAGTTYGYRVQAFDINGFSSPGSSPVYGTTDAATPGTPTIGSASAASQTTATVTWTRNSPYDESGFNIYMYGSNVLVGSALAGATSGTASGLATGSSYSFYVESYVNTNGRTYYSASSTVSNAITTDAATPGTPTIGSASPTSQTTDNVTWTRNSPTDESGFQIQDVVVGTQVGSSTAGSTNGTANVGSIGLSSSCLGTGGYSDAFQVRSYVYTNTRYYYSGWSSTSNTTTTDLCTPGTPTIGTATAASQTTATVTWTRNSPTDESGFYIYEASPSAGTLVGSAGAGATSGTASGLSAGTAYTFYAAAYVNTNGRTYYSASSTVSNAITTDAATCGTPTTPTNTAYSQTQFQLSYSPQSPLTQSGYQAFGQNSQVTTDVGNNTSPVIGGYSPGATETFEERCYTNTNGRTYYSGYSSFSPNATIVAIGSSTLSGPASPTSSTSPGLSWGALSGSGFTGYNLYRNSALYGRPPGTSFTDSVTQGSYTYYIKGRDLNGYEGPASNSITVLVDTTPPSAPSLSPTSYGWGQGPVTVSFSSTDTGGSGLAGYEYYSSTNGSTSTPNTSGSSSVTFSTQNQYTLCANASDNAGNVSQTTCSAANAYKVDTTPPSVPSAPYCSSGCTGSGTPYNNSGNFTISWGASTDTGGSGLYQYNLAKSFDGGIMTTFYSTTSPNSYIATSTAQGTYAYEANAEDNALNQSAYSSSSPTIIVDLTPPTCGTWSPSSPSWTTSTQPFTLSSSTDTGGSGINVSGGNCSVATNGGTCNVSISDNAGNTTSCTSPPARIDPIAPTVTALSPLATYTSSSPILNYTVTDTGGSNLSNVQLWRTIDSGGTPSSTLWAQVSSASASGTSTSGSFTDTSATANTTYWYGIHTLDAAGNCINESGGHCGGVSSDSLDPRPSVGPDKVVYDTTPPTVSGNNSSSGWYNASTAPTITLSASDSGGAGLNGVTVRYIWNNPTGCSAAGTVYTNGGTTSIPGQGTNTLYLCAADNAGNTGSWSGPYNLDTTPPSPNPPSISCGASSQSAINCSIGSETDNQSGMNSSSPYGFATASGGPYSWQTGTSTSVSGLSCGTGYTRYAEAQDAVSNTTSPGSASTLTYACTPGAPSPAPTSQSAITVSWSAPSGSVSSYHIQRNGVDIATVGSSTYSYSDSGLTAATSYTYAIEACDSSGCSPWGSTTSATTGSTAPAAPSAVNSYAPSGLWQVNTNWSGSTASGVGTFINGTGISGTQVFTAATASSTGSSTRSVVCPGAYTVYTVTYNNSTVGDGSCNTWSQLSSGAIPSNDVCTVTTSTVSVNVCTQGFFGH